MVRATIKGLLTAAWVALLTAGCAGGFTFLVAASAVVELEKWCERRGIPTN